jgi:hypothetical protein
LPLEALVSWVFSVGTFFPATFILGIFVSLVKRSKSKVYVINLIKLRPFIPQFLNTKNLIGYISFFQND